MDNEKINHTQSGRGYLLRISASEICNYDCNFCHPTNNERVKPLTDEELLKIIRTMCKLYKLKTIHFTGGEPLTRKTIPSIIKECRKYTDDDCDIAMTTNASLLSRYIDDLLEAGLTRANISLHSLDEKKYKEFTGTNFDVKKIMDNILEAKEKGLKIKINSVVIRGFNDQDLTKTAQFCFENGIIPRFLELGLYGPVKQWYSEKDRVSHNEIVERLSEKFGTFERDFTYRGNGPSKYYTNENGEIFGVLDNQSDQMCRGCDRFRLNANGYIKVCNFKPIDLRPYLSDEKELEKQLLKLGKALDSRGNDYIGKRLHKNDYYFRWNHPELNKEYKKEL